MKELAKSFSSVKRCFYESRFDVPDSAFLNIKSREEHQNGFPLFSCRFCLDPLRQNILAICDEVGYVNLYDVERETKNNFTLKRFSAHENAVFDLTWLPSNPKQMITVSADRTANLWDVEYGTLISTFRGHEGSVKCVSACFDDQNLFVTGGRDGHIMVWDARNRVKIEKGIAPVNRIRNAHYVMTPFVAKNSPKLKPRSRSLDSPTPITAVLFHDLCCIYSGACKESHIRCWDLRKTYTFLKNDPIPIGKFAYNNDSVGRPSVRRAGFTFFTTNAYRSSLFAACTDNTIYEYSLSGGDNKPVAQFRGAVIRSFYVQCAVSPNLQYLIAGSSDNKAYIWNLRKPDSPLYYLGGHRQEVTSVAFNDRLDLVTCSDDFSWRLWTLHPSQQRDHSQFLDTVTVRRFNDVKLSV